MSKKKKKPLKRCPPLPSLQDLEFLVMEFIAKEASYYMVHKGKILCKMFIKENGVNEDDKFLSRSGS